MITISLSTDVLSAQTSQWQPTAPTISFNTPRPISTTAQPTPSRSAPDLTSSEPTSPQTGSTAQRTTSPAPSSASRATGSSVITSDGATLTVFIPSVTDVRSVSAPSSKTVLPNSISVLSTESGANTSTPKSATAANTSTNRIRAWIIVLIVACVILVLLLIYCAIWLLRKRRSTLREHGLASCKSESTLHTCSGSTERFPGPELAKDILTLARLSSASPSPNLRDSKPRSHTPSIHYTGERVSSPEQLFHTEQPHIYHGSGDFRDFTSTAPALGSSQRDHAYVRPSARPSGRPTLRLSIGSIDSFLRHSDALPSSTTWQSPQRSLHPISPRLSIRPPSQVIVLGRLSWQEALTPRTTMPRSVSDLPSWPARPASHARPRGPRPQGNRSTRGLDCDQDITGALENSTQLPYRRRAEDGGVRLAGGPLPLTGQSESVGDKGGDGQASSETTGEGSSEVSLPPAYAMY